ncbi:MAG: lysophospholipid acyltransferase family protein [Chloroflexota bacterium]
MRKATEHQHENTIFAHILRFLFFLIIVRPVMWYLLGLKIRNRRRLPQSGPAIVIANHNSHFDTMVMMSLFSLFKLPSVHPVAAADYWMRNRWITWFALNIVGIVPVLRSSDKEVDPLEPCYQALQQNKILIYFPEGSRGEPEQMTEFKAGILRLAEKFPEVPITPVFLHGLGKIVPRGTSVFVPLFCDVFVGEAVKRATLPDDFLKNLANTIVKLGENLSKPRWD